VTGKKSVTGKKRVTKKVILTLFFFCHSERQRRISSFFTKKVFLISEFLRFAQDSAYGDLPPRNDKKRRRPFPFAASSQPLRMTGLEKKTPFSNGKFSLI